MPSDVPDVPMVTWSQEVNERSENPRLPRSFALDVGILVATGE